jgi:hypothetical protein
MFLFCDLVHNGVTVFHTTYLQTVGQWWTVNWIGFGRKRPWPNQGAISIFAWSYWGKLGEASVRTVGVPAEIRTEYHSNISTDHYHHDPAPYHFPKLKNPLRMLSTVLETLLDSKWSTGYLEFPATVVLIQHVACLAVCGELPVTWSAN